ncbi:serine/threonine-protein kinase [Geminocystis sp. CENA526]|uniref:serine/threonine-protein kinase n=1 Tax=Geminocystis sp. CENA526 TaxID=1355871 RepID=UPI003D6E1E84
MSQGDLSKENLLVKRYQLQEVIGQGAMGIVYRAEDTVSKNHSVAVKILSKALDDMKMIKRFQKEATISALLSERSDNIVRVTDYGVDQHKTPFYVMEYLNGENLDDFIEIHNLSLTQFLDFSRQICLAMETAHNGIFFEGEICPVIHRDLKPSNIFIIEDDTGKQIIKVLDFGIAKLVKDDKGDTEAFMGTPRYCSPEQIQGLDLDNRSDIYSLGMVMYLMLAQKYPWELEINSIAAWYKAHTELTPAPFPPELNIPPELEKLILKCLEKSPNYRPQSIGEITQKLDFIARKINPESSIQKIEFEQSQLVNVEQKSPLETFLLTAKWPSNKPQQKIVFPRIFPFEKKVYPSICTMLELEDIKKRSNNIRYNQFLFQSYPHPMILWLTVLYSLEDGARWLPCYLDLKTKIGQQMVTILSESKQYFLLFYSLGNPDKCQDLLSFKVMLKQRTNLKQWASVSNMLNIKHNDEAVISRKKLKEDLELLKPKILLEIEKSQTQEIHG